ncbi:exodeoxyribonuclease V subunit beta [Motiliproteus sediminis]|uniref:exodeoxyribonuclease V subunit beta n=1 Tax=Motiliproteus sediminis TaxID=1468178 RepID=UPI001AEFF174|nr:exodeoxyribonuclease V subunit beta [Motiliproteus sediminis]
MNGEIQARLEPAELTLTGRQLIEASAGTGKTYNITRLYIRLLLERRLTVQQLLVMTFTKAATEELRGRIDRELRNAAAHWGRLGESDPFFAAMEQRLSAAQAVPLLQSALLHLDEAAIFTIHSFSARVLKQHALASAMPMELEMEADTSAQLLEAVRDWLRGIAHGGLYQQLSERGWHTPEAFIRLFGNAIRSSAELLAAEPAQLVQAALTIKRDYRTQLLDHESELFAALIEGRNDADERQAEWVETLEWLANDDLNSIASAAKRFLHGGRFNSQKAQHLKPLLEPFKELKKTLPKLAEAAEQATIYPYLREGIAAIRSRFAASKTQLGLMDFDDLITLLSQRVVSDAGAPLVAAMRQQYPVALVDEFQDTDPHQYAILERVYRPRSETVGDHASAEIQNSATALFMIGDPKQAIYSFRGGDIFTYLSARNGADDQWQMDTNWRSVPAMVAGYNRLFRGAPDAQPAAPVFGFGIDYQPVKAARAAQSSFAHLIDPLPPGEPPRAALNYVWLTPAEGADGDSVTGEFRHSIASWCCSEIDRLLNSPARLGTAPTDSRVLQESDIAILVRTGTEADVMQQALLQAGYSSVYLSARDNIFDSPEASELALVLQGILAPEQSGALLAACATSLLGGDAKRLACLNGDADALVAMRYRLIALREQWQREGFIAMMMALIHDHLNPPPTRHERCLTNHIHLAELLQQASGNLRHPQQLLEWLHDQVQAAVSDTQAELRLESDANLIRIVTQHGSKGLEYPVVFVPFANYPKEPLKFGNRKQEFLSYHHPDSGAALQMIGRTPEAEQRATDEAYAEAIRLLYVAVTRAEQRCYLCCAPFNNSAASPLARALGCGSRVAGEPNWPQLLAEQLAGDSEACALISLRAEGWPSPQGPQRGDGSPPTNVAQFSRHIDRDWRLSSFSALTRNLGHARRDRKDHDDDQTGAAVVEVELPLRFRLPKGAHAGNLLHDVLEHTDFSAPRWAEVLRDPLLRFGQLAETEQPLLQQWLQACVETELPAIGAGTALRLAELNWPATLREAEFYFPLGGLNLDQLALLLARHRGTESALQLPGSARLRGMMHGFIDLIFEHRGRYYLADYKSTHLGNSLTDYGYAALKANNEAHFYDLQYLIYAVALHRYLRDRVADYDPGCHFGGVYYLYLRGMQPGSDSGVFHCALEPPLLNDLDALFATGSWEGNG